jgi:LuxR family maltose regulon positive regulatory protein
MDDGSASLAKITRPLLSGNFPRRRLFRRIDLVLKRSSLWVTGPAGSGKTTLVSSYLADRRLSGLWYRLEEGDADPETFFHYLGLAVRKAAPRFRMPLPSLTPDQLPAVAMFSRRYFEILFSRLRAGSVIVFDDFQKVPPEATFHAMIRDGLSMIPPRVRVLLISREQPPPAFARFRAGRSLEVLGWKELRLSPRETEGIARLGGKGQRGTAVVRSLQRMSAGWAAGLVLLLEKSAPGEAAPRKIPSDGMQEIFDYFASEILDGMDEEVRSFLMKSAHLPRMTADMAARLTGVRRAGKILFHMNRSNRFTEVRPDSDPVFEYHPLFREFLKSRASDTYPEKYIQRLRGKAAGILEASGHAEEAAGILREIGDWRGFSRILIRQAATLAAQGRIRTLGDWLEAVPERVTGKDPWLMYWSGMVGLVSRPGDCLGIFEKAFRVFSRRKDRDGALLAWAGAVDAIVYGPGGLKALDPWFAALEKPWKDGKPPLPEKIDFRVTCSMIKALSMRRPPFVDMEAWADRAMRVAQSAPDVSMQFTALLNVAYYRFHGGDFPSTGLLLDTLHGMAARPELSPLSRLNLCWLEAAYANANGRHEHVLKVVSEGTELANATGVHLMDNLLAGHGALSCLHKGDMTAARGYLRKMASSLAAARPWEASFYHYLAAWASLQGGEKAQAVIHSDRCLALCEEMGNPWTEALAHLQRFFVLLGEGDPHRATRHLIRAQRIGKTNGMRFIRFACLLAEAYACLLQGKEADGLAPLREGLRIGKEQGYFDIYLWRPGMLEKVSAKALEKGIETVYVLELIRRNALVPPDVPEGAGHWPWPLKIHTLGTFGLLKEDRPFVFSRKEQRKPLLMLKALVALGGKDVPEEQLTDILWPEAEGDHAHQAFATTLGRLRAMLGNEKALTLRGSRLTLDPGHCWVDAFAFESLLERIDASVSFGEAFRDGTNAGNLARNAIALYKGPFVPGESPHSCIVAMRERLRSKFLRVVGLLGRGMEMEGRWAEAVACYRRGLEVEDLAEGLYQRLMICHHRAGQPAEALAAYRRCEKTLSAALGIAPSVETERIAKGVLPA